MPWKTKNRADSCTSAGKLQFGHGGDAVENVEGGKKGKAKAALQFGHGGDAVENFPSSKSTSIRR